MHTLELLLAAQVLTLATDIRYHARSTFFASIFEQSNEVQRELLIQNWDEENPISKFIPTAFQNIDQVARQISVLQGTGHGSNGSASKYIAADN